MIFRTLHLPGDNGDTTSPLLLEPGLHVLARLGDAVEQPLPNPFDVITGLLYPAGGRLQGGRLGLALRSGEERVVSLAHASMAAYDENDEALAFGVQVTDIAGHPMPVGLETPGDNGAGQHWLGLPRSLFQALAHIGQEQLDALGDAPDLETLSKHLAALADSGAPLYNAVEARRWLDNRILFIGRGGTPAKPLTRLRNRCNALERELEFSRNSWRDLRTQWLEQEQLEEELARLHARRKQVEKNLLIWDAYERAAQLERAEALRAEVREATKRCFSLSTAREFPSEIAPVLREQENRLRTAQMQHERSLAALDALMERVREHDIHLDEPETTQRAERDIPEGLEDTLRDKAAYLQELGNQLEVVQEQMEDAEMRLLQAQERSAVLPDFSRFAADPIEWITQLTHSLEVAIRTRDEECAHRDQLQAEYDINKARNAHAASLFDGMDNFHGAIHNYEQQRSALREDQWAQNRQWQLLNLEYEEINERMPAFLWMAPACGLFFVMTLAAYLHYLNPGILISTVLMFVSFLYFLGNYVYAKKRLAQLETELKMLDTRRKPGGELVELTDKWGELPRSHATGHESRGKDVERIENMLRRAGCESIRELEAMYDTYTEAVSMLKAHLDVLNAAKERAKEAEERVPRLLQRIQKTFQPIGIVIASEHEVKEAGGNAIARYQEYREAKRRVTDYRSLLERHQQEYARLKEQHAMTRQVLAEAESKLQQHVERFGFGLGNIKLPPLDLIAQYNEYLEAQDPDTSLQDNIREEYERLTARIAEESAVVKREEASFVTLLGKAGVKRLDEWLQKEALHQEYQEAWEERVQAENALEELLQGRDIAELQARVEAESPLPECPERPKEALRAEMHALGSAIEQREMSYREQQMRLTQRQMNISSVTVLEETLAWNRKRLDELSIELEAASRALTLMDDAARATRQELIPGLCERIRPHLEMLSGGKYHDLHLDGEFSLTLRGENGAQVLEADAAKQRPLLELLYFGLHFALLQEMTAHREPVPLLLNEAFAGYDDWQLERTFRLLHRMAGDQHQVLVYSTRDDVVQAAEAVQTSVHYV